MAARTLPTNVTMSNFGIPMDGEVKKTPAIVTDGNGGYAYSVGVVSGDAITIGADYGIFSTTHTQNVPPEITTFRDPV